jgi:hypothetical protein
LNNKRPKRVRNNKKFDFSHHEEIERQPAEDEDADNGEHHLNHLKSKRNVWNYYHEKVIERNVHDESLKPNCGGKVRAARYVFRHG